MDNFDRSFVAQGPTRSSSLHKRLRHRKAPAVSWANFDMIIESEVNILRAEHARSPITIWSTSLHAGLKLATRRVATFSKVSSEDSKTCVLKKKVELELVKNRVLKSGKNVKIWANHFTSDAHTVAATMISHPFFAAEVQENTKDFEVACFSFPETPRRSLVVAIITWMGSEHIPFNMDLTLLGTPVLAEPRCAMMRRLLEELCLTAINRKGPLYRCKENCVECDKMGALLRNICDDWYKGSNSEPDTYVAQENVEDTDGRRDDSPVEFRKPRHEEASRIQSSLYARDQTRRNEGADRHSKLRHEDSRREAATRRESSLHEGEKHSIHEDTRDEQTSWQDGSTHHSSIDARQFAREGRREEVNHSEDEVSRFADHLSEGMEVLAVTGSGAHCPVVIKSDSHSFYLSILKGGDVVQTKVMKLSDIFGAESKDTLVSIDLDEEMKFTLLMPTGTHAHFLARLLTAFGKGSCLQSDANSRADSTLRNSPRTGNNCKADSESSFRKSTGGASEMFRRGGQAGSESSFRKSTGGASEVFRNGGQAGSESSFRKSTGGASEVFRNRSETCDEPLIRNGGQAGSESSFRKSPKARDEVPKSCDEAAFRKSPKADEAAIRSPKVSDAAAFRNITASCSESDSVRSLRQRFEPNYATVRSSLPSQAFSSSRTGCNVETGTQPQTARNYHGTEDEHDAAPIPTPRERAYHDITRRADEYIFGAKTASPRGRIPSSVPSVSHPPRMHPGPAAPADRSFTQRDGAADLADTNAARLRGEQLLGRNVDAQVRELHQRAANAQNRPVEHITPTRIETSTSEAHKYGLPPRSDTFAPSPRTRAEPRTSAQPRQAVPSRQGRTSEQKRTGDSSSSTPFNVSPFRMRGGDGPSMPSSSVFGIPRNTPAYDASPFRAAPHWTDRPSVPWSARGSAKESAFDSVRNNGSRSARYAPTDIGGSGLNFSRFDGVDMSGKSQPMYMSANPRGNTQFSHAAPR